MSRQKIEIDVEKLKDALENAPSALAASVLLGMKFSTFKRRCLEEGLYIPNQGRKGHSRPCEIPVENLVTARAIKKQLVERSMLKNECSACGLQPMWNGKPLVLQLDHINGNGKDNSEENLRLLCPNCHTQTPTWGRKKRALVAELVDAQR